MLSGIFIFVVVYLKDLCCVVGISLLD